MEGEQVEINKSQITKYPYYDLGESTIWPRTLQTLDFNEVSVKYGAKRAKPWCAKIVDLDEKYGVQRVFCKKDITENKFIRNNEYGNPIVHDEINFHLTPFRIHHYGRCVHDFISKTEFITSTSYFAVLEESVVFLRNNPSGVKRAIEESVAQGLNGKIHEEILTKYFGEIPTHYFTEDDIPF